MAQRVDIVVTDDFDGTPGAQTIQFGLDGTAYTVDLSAEHEEQFRSFLNAYIGVGRKTSRGGIAAPARRRTGKGGSGNDENTAVRAWAQENGYSLGARGRIPQEIKDAYHAAQGAPAAAAAAAPVFTKPEPEAQA